MARKAKIGIDYYPMDVTFTSDRRVRKLVRACGPDSIFVLIDLLGNIYRYKGYYLEWDEDMCFDISYQLEGISEEGVQAVVDKAIEVEFFHKGMYEAHKILTSVDIQDHYQFATKKRSHVHSEGIYWINSPEMPVSAPETSISGSEIPQKNIIEYNTIEDNNEKAKSEPQSVEPQNFSQKNSDPESCAERSPRAAPAEFTPEVTNFRDWAKELLSDPDFVVNTGHLLSIDEIQMATYLEKFLQQKIALQQATWKTEEDLRRNFFFWLGKKVPNDSKARSSTDALVTPDSLNETWRILNEGNRQTG